VVEQFKQKIISRADRYITASSIPDSVNGWTGRDRDIFLKIINASDNEFSQWVSDVSVRTCRTTGATQVVDVQDKVEKTTAGLLSLDNNRIVITSGDMSHKPPSSSKDTLLNDVMEDEVPPSNPYLAWRAKKIQLNNEKLRSLDLIDDEVLRKEVGQAWSLGTSASSGSKQDKKWCDFSTMTANEIPIKNASVIGGSRDKTGGDTKIC
jgi:hypothetical protein